MRTYAKFREHFVELVKDFYTCLIVKIMYYFYLMVPYDRANDKV